MTNRRKIIAVDFDGTCVTHAFPKVGNHIGAVPVLKRLVKNGHQIILWTLRSNGNLDGDHLDDAVNWFIKNGIPLYGTNENPNYCPWIKSPKIHADIYIDDLALGCPIMSDNKLAKRSFVDWFEIERVLKGSGYFDREDIPKRKIKKAVSCHHNDILEFKGKYKWLSNFKELETPIVEIDENNENIYYKTTEHFYVSMKTHNYAIKREMSKLKTAGEAKKFGQRMELINDWDSIKLGVMETALRIKFCKDNPILRQKLLNTGDCKIEEGNYWHDKFWGVCRKTNIGENNLGNLLMKIRSDIREEDKQK